MMDRMDLKLEKLSELEASYKYPRSYILMQMIGNSDDGIVMRISDTKEDLISSLAKNGDYKIITGANLV